MFKHLSRERFQELSEQNKRIVVYKEIAGDRLTPINAYLALQGFASDIALLESSPKEKVGRYSYLCFDPRVTIQARGKTVTINDRGDVCTREADPFDVLRQYQQKMRARTDHPLSGFVGGMLGFLSYDAIRLIENIPDRHANTNHIPDILFRFYQSNIVFDHHSGKVVLCTLADVGDDVSLAYDQAMAGIEKMQQRLFVDANHTRVSPDNSEAEIEIKTDHSDQEYVEQVNKAKQYIVEGDVFQVVLSREFNIQIQADPFNVYRALRFSNPSPYMFYLTVDDYAIAGASPEKLISISDGVIESRPLAGTRKRGERPDEEVGQELLSDPKEVAEHMMLVDLARNDTGKVAKLGSVEVTQCKTIEQYTRVMHIASSVEGVLRDDQDVFDALKAAFPAGTLSGAPKIRAMEIIDELESSRRGVYGGVVCAIDSNDNLISCITIRTAFIKDGVARVRAGAGIVFDSDPQLEADETRHKAKAIVEGIALAEQGVL